MQENSGRNVLIGLSDKCTEGRTERCTEVADRPLPDGEFFGRNFGDRRRSAARTYLVNQSLASLVFVTSI